METFVLKPFVVGKLGLFSGIKYQRVHDLPQMAYDPATPVTTNMGDQVRFSLHTAPHGLIHLDYITGWM